MFDSLGVAENTKFVAQKGDEMEKKRVWIYVVPRYFSANASSAAICKSKPKTM